MNVARTWKRVALAVGALLALSEVGEAGGIDCKKPHGRFEKVMCSDAALVGADVEMNTVYNELAKRMRPRAARALKQSQGEWLVDVRGCGDSRNCMAELYRRRTAELRQMLRARAAK